MQGPAEGRADHLGDEGQLAALYSGNDEKAGFGTYACYLCWVCEDIEL